MEVWKFDVESFLEQQTHGDGGGGGGGQQRVKTKFVGLGPVFVSFVCVEQEMA